MKLKILILVFLSISIISCRRNDTSNRILKNVAMEMASIESAPPNDNSNFKSDENNDIANQVIPDKKKIIKDGTIKIDVENIKESKTKLDLIVKTFKGYISNESFNDEYGTKEYNIKIRVPSVYFDSVITAIEHGNKNIISKSISARDVTVEFIDLETRLANKRNYLLRYNELLKKAKSVQEILEIEEKTRGIEEEIESTEGKLKYLNDLVSLSTLDVTLVIKSEYIDKTFFKGKFFKRLGLAFISGWFGLIEFFIYIFRIWPIWILTFLTIYVIRRIKKNKNRKI
jgi:hypothetical protein